MASGGSGVTDAPGPGEFRSTIDEAVHANVEAMGEPRAGEGFFTRISREMEDEGKKEVTFRVGKERAEVDERMPLAGLMASTVQEARGFVEMLKRYGAPDKSLVLYTDDGVMATLDERRERGPAETVRLSFAYARDWIDWEKVFGMAGAVEHRSLLKFLIAQQHNLVETELLDRMRSIKATATIDLDSDVRLEHESAGVKFKVQGDESLIKFPRAFTIRLPVLDIDVDDEDKWVTVPVRVEVVLPDNPNGRVGFQLIAPTLKAVRRQRIDKEINVVREGLGEGWLITRGLHDHKDRPLLREQVDEE